MPVHNQDITKAFSEIADLLEIQGSNPFRIRAYRNAARVVEDLGEDVQQLVDEGQDLTGIQGIGKDLAAKMSEMVTTGQMKALEELRQDLPPRITDLLNLPGLGPKKVKVLYEKLDVGSLEGLRKVAQAGKISKLDGFGSKTEEQILKSIDARADTTKRFLRANVTPYVQALIAYLEDIAGVNTLTVAGSYRRARETVGDLDLLAVTSKSSPVMDRFVAYDEVTDVLAHGKTKSSVLLRSGIQVDLRTLEAKSYGAALHYFTGSKAHNIAVRKRGQKRKLKINEYGVFRGEKHLCGKTEEEVFEAVGLPFIVRVR